MTNTHKDPTQSYHSCDYCGQSHPYKSGMCCWDCPQHPNKLIDRTIASLNEAKNIIRPVSPHAVEEISKLIVDLTMGKLPTLTGQITVTGAKGQGTCTANEIHSSSPSPTVINDDNECNEYCGR